MYGLVFTCTGASSEMSVCLCGGQGGTTGGGAGKVGISRFL